MRRSRPALRLAPLAALLVGCSIEGSTPLTVAPEGLVTGLRLEPRPVTVRAGARTPVTVLGITSDGAPVPLPVAIPPQLSTSDARVATATAGDSAFVTGVAAGSTWLHATLGRWRDSVAVTVTP